MLSLLLSLMLATPISKPAPPTPPPDLAAPPADAERSGTGLVFRVLTPPSGEGRASEESLAKIRYTIWTSAGKLIQDVRAPLTVVVPVNTMIPGLREALLSMKEGERRRLWIPESLGAMGKVPAGGHLLIDAELVSVIVPPSVPPSVTAPPPDATVTKSGLAYKVLRAGNGTRHPKSNDTVVVHYSGWTTNGHMFDSSILRGEPSEFPLNMVIKGWREGLGLMTEGEKTRFWIPSKLAYDNEPGKPQGMLVFDVEMVKIR
jgi:peptidylprolyl isomerase